MRITPDDILNGPPGRTLFRMTLPMVIGITVMNLFHAVDTFFVSLLGTEQLAAVSFTFPVTYFVMNLGVGFGVGVSVILARAIGAREHDRAQRITLETVVLILIFAAVMTVLGLASVDPLFRLLGAGDDTLVLIHEYIDVWYLGCGLMIFMITGNGILRATGDTRWPSLMLMISSVLNVVLDPLLIFGYGPWPALGIRGASIATVLAYLVSVITSICILYFREKLLIFRMPDLRGMVAYWGELCRVALPISGANMLLPVAAAALTALVARFGEHAVAGFGAGTRIEAVAMILCIAITSALSPFMAQNIGAGNHRRARATMHAAIRFALLFELGLWPVLALTAPWLAAIFSREPQVMEITVLFLWIIPAGFGFYGVIIIINTGFNAARQSHKTLIASLVRLLVCYIPMAWAGSLLFGLRGLFVGAVFGNGVAAFIAWRMVDRTYQALVLGEGPAAAAPAAS